MKKFLVVLLAVVSVLGLAACQGQEKKIGFAASTFTNPFFNDIEDGIEEVLEGTEYTLISLGADNDATKQVGQVEDLIAQKVDLILLNPVDSTTAGAMIKEANDAGIPVITVDRSADSGEVVAHVASDNVAGGKMAAEYLQTVCPDGAAVLQLTGQSGASAATDRQAGFEEIWGVDNIDQTSTANWDRTQAQNVTEAFISAQDVSNGLCIFAANDEMALGAVLAIETAGVENAFVVGFDAIQDALDAVDAGRMAGTVAQQPVEIGKMAAQIALDYLDGQDVESNVPVDLAVITKETE